jgi:hypothetical protein
MTHDIAGAALALRRRRLNGKPVYQAKKSMCVRKSHAARTQSSIAMLALCGLNDHCRKGAGHVERVHLGRNKAGSCTAAAAESAECCSCSMTLWRVTVRSRSGMIVPYGGIAPPFQFAG